MRFNDSWPTVTLLWHYIYNTIQCTRRVCIQIRIYMGDSINSWSLTWRRVYTVVKSMNCNQWMSRDVRMSTFASVAFGEMSGRSWKSFGVRRTNVDSTRITRRQHGNDVTTSAMSRRSVTKSVLWQLADETVVASHSKITSKRNSSRLSLSLLQRVRSAASHN